jgi:hypothetical protein
MPTNSLLPFNPDNAVHGAEVTLAIQLANGTYLTIGELYGFDWDEDQGMVKIGTFGSRLVGQKRGEFTVNGTFNGYFLNGAVRSMWQGYATALSTGVTSAIYHSQSTFQRYRIRWTSTNSSMPGPVDFMNVTLSKDAMKMAHDKVMEETITWQAEDVFGL